MLPMQSPPFCIDPFEVAHFFCKCIGVSKDKTAVLQSKACKKSS